MAELAFLPGPPILQVAGQKFLTRNEAMRSLLGHLGKESFHTFRGFKPPLVCPLVGKKKEAGCTREEGCIARMTKEDRPKTSGFAQVMPLCQFDRYRRSQILFSRLVPTLVQPRPASTSLPGLLEGRPRSAIVSFFALSSVPNTLLCGLSPE